MKNYICLIIILCFGKTYGQIHKSCIVRDATSGQRLEEVMIDFPDIPMHIFSDREGSFVYPISKDKFSFNVVGNEMAWQSDMTFSMAIFGMDGIKYFDDNMFKSGTGVLQLVQLPNGIYLISASTKTLTITKKIYIHEALSYGIQNGVPLVGNMICTKSGYEPVSIDIQGYPNEVWLTKKIDGDVTHLERLVDSTAFNILSSAPFSPVFGEVQSLKFLYQIDKDKDIFFNSKKFFTHYLFASEILNYQRGKQLFSIEQYTYNENRIYIPAILNYFTSSKKYVLEFSPFTEVSCDDIRKIYASILRQTYIPEKNLYFLDNKAGEPCDEIKTVSTTELYNGQNYQALNIAEAYGFLRKIDIDSLERTYTSWQDIIILNGIPADLNIVSGLITTNFQTPLSHVNILSHNRKSPNMGLKDAWTNPVLSSLMDKLVYLRVALDSFIIREASLAEANAFWDEHRPVAGAIIPSKDLSIKDLVDLDNYGAGDVGIIGGKAANFAELLKIKFGDQLIGIPVPEYGFAIPVYYYDQHLKSNGIDVWIEKLLKDSLVYKDPAYRKNQLLLLQTMIINAPINQELLLNVRSKIESSDPSSNYKFRSSTNAEDIENFNGAGLYDSFTGHLTKADKTIDLAIKKTWASMWNLRAFDERSFFRIDHIKCAMAILVHRSFPNELANGVVITKNIYNQYNGAIIINVQVGETSIVRPEDTYYTDQIIYYDSKLNNEAFEYISHTNVPGYEGKNILTDEELKQLQLYCLAIQAHFCTIQPPCKPMDIEFKIDLVNGERKMYIKQARYY